MNSTSRNPAYNEHGIFHAAHGYCRNCRRLHALPMESALQQCRQLMATFETSKSIDRTGSCTGDPALSTDYLFGDARGKMFGVLAGTDTKGRERVLYAFSGQYNGRWTVPGWVPPLFDLDRFHRVHDSKEQEIKALTRRLSALPHDSEERRTLVHERKQRSRALMQEIFDMYELRNFNGDRTTLSHCFNGNGLPTGTGDCCAPKLLVRAASLGITPTGMAEFYWGRENKSATRHHKHFYHSCREKCQPLLGFLLCGI